MKTLTIKNYFSLILILILPGCCGTQPMINFKNLTLPNTPNYYLACPATYCNVKPQGTIKTYKMGVNQLISAWNQMIHEQPRVRLVQSEPQTYQYQYVQRSLVFRFPDDIDVQFIPLTEDESTLAIYSRARYGHYDFHVNEKRVEHWLESIT